MMPIKIFIRLLLIVVYMSMGSLLSSTPAIKKFIASFIEHYDFKVEGRNTHEYHRDLLELTAHGFDELETRLANEGLNLVGRIVIAGYEANAIPSYYTDVRTSIIDDEGSSAHKGAWSMQLHNQFGLMTGFLLKDVAHLVSPAQRVFEHINPESIEIFHDHSGILQEHAFRESLPVMTNYREFVEKALLKKDHSRVFELLMKFWQNLYDHQLKAQKTMLAGTQDILFSIAYGDHLRRSSIPFIKYYTGGDITYPIETFKGQTAQATKTAQDFVQHFTPTLKAHHDKKTVYVFCSFVDGVGKSTMLGNVQNWLKYGNDIASYDRVDNSSSQLAQLFAVSDNVFIADLPAQISHFTYKPDGLVYVPIESEVNEELGHELVEHVKTTGKDHITAFYELGTKVHEILTQDGPHAAVLNDPANPAMTFVKNIYLLHKFDNTWVPFTYQGEHYVFNNDMPQSIRILRPIANAPSAGLKNIDPGQMLFYEGVRFPLTYDIFLQHLVDQIKQTEIEEVIFVDFLSMYPRSSRENIRINYVLQQMALINKHGFNVEESLYKAFATPAELFADLATPKKYKHIFQGFMQEVFVRAALYQQLITQHDNGSIAAVPIHTLTEQLRNRINNMLEDDDFFNDVKNRCTQKFAQEFKQLKQDYGLTKDFINVYQCSLYDAYLFSTVIEQCMKQSGNERLVQLWSNLDEPIKEQSELYCGLAERVLELTDGTGVMGRFEFPLDYRGKTERNSCIKMLRAAWYATLSNLLESTSLDHENVLITAEKTAVTPFVIKLTEQNHLYIVQKQLEAHEGKTVAGLYQYGISMDKNSRWGTFATKPYYLNWDAPQTSKKVFAFDCNLSGKKDGESRYLTPISKIVYKYQEACGFDKVMPTSLLYEKILKKKRFPKDRESRLTQAKKNGDYPRRSDDQEEQKQTGARIYLGRADQRVGAQLLVVMLATCEMLIKDPHADVALRRGNKKDFAAALHLFEEITLPKYFNVIFEEPLFENYDAVEPLIPWDYFEQS